MTATKNIIKNKIVNKINVGSFLLIYNNLRSEHKRKINVSNIAEITPKDKDKINGNVIMKNVNHLS
jgi:hypothetical protein